MGLSLVVENCSVRSHTLSMPAITRDHQRHLIPPTQHLLKIFLVSRRKESTGIDIGTRMLKVQITRANHILSVNSMKATKNDCYHHRSSGVRGGAVWFRQCATSLKVAGSIPDGATGIFH